ncbi:MAG: sigma-70 family RNA polymerase sigma factor [Cloacibacterium sp.]|nr:sigma-70 family RNA polymerase sigma factor [Cloacibacterium sp.]
MKNLEHEFLEKIENHKAMIFKISKMYVDGKEDRADLYQEIIFQTWKAYPSFQGKSEFSTWLYRVALNTAIVFLKSEKKRHIFSRQETYQSYQLDIKDEKYDHEKDTQIERLYQAIHQLNPIDKALIFYSLENYSHRQVAEQMGITEVNARVKLNRAKNKLKELLYTENKTTTK